MKDLTPIKTFITSIVESTGLITQPALELKIKGEFLSANQQEILQALSEAAQEGMIKRFEYSIKSKGYHYHYFYLPYDARLS